MFDEAVDLQESDPLVPSKRSALVLVAHPDDETLWVGGTMLMRRDWQWVVACLCRGDDKNRRPKFFAALDRLGAIGSIGNLDDGPNQDPLADLVVQRAMRGLLPNATFDLIITHSPLGEYTRHRRHEEVGRAALHLWQTGALTAREMWLFAYTDDNRTHYPSAVAEAHRVVSLPPEIAKEKQSIIQNIYGFAPQSWEAMTTPVQEAFWCLNRPEEAIAWIEKDDNGEDR